MKIELIKSENILDNSVNLLFGGDFCPRNHYEEKLLRDEPIFSEPIMHEFSNKDWLTVNLETPLWNCDGGNSGLKCDPKVATKLRNLNIDMVSFANNHALDRGDNGMRQTLRLLKDNGIVYGGAGENRQEASKLNIIEQNGLKIGIWCIAEKEYNIAPPESYGTAYFLPEANVLTIAEYRSQVDFLIVFVHAGHEFMMTPSPRIRDAYRTFVNAGADLVIGHHPHVVQGWECYNGKWIFYSLGNLVFDSPYVSGYDNTDWGYLVRAKVGCHKINALEVIVYNLRIPEYVIGEFSTEEFEKRRQTLYDISTDIVDDKRFEAAWTEGVIRRWNEDYKQLFSSIASSINGGPENGFNFLRNILWCPTHTELVLKALELKKDGLLDF